MNMDFALHKVQGKVCTFACTTEWRHLYDGNVFALVSREKVLISDFIYAGVMCDNQLTLLRLLQTLKLTLITTFYTEKVGFLKVQEKGQEQGKSTKN